MLCSSCCPSGLWVPSRLDFSSEALQVELPFLQPEVPRADPPPLLEGQDDTTCAHVTMAPPRGAHVTFFLCCLWCASFCCKDPNLKLECSSAEFSESCRRRTRPKAPQRWAAERLLKPGHLHRPAPQPELRKHTHCTRGSEQRSRLTFRQEAPAQSRR